MLPSSDPVSWVPLDSRCAPHTPEMLGARSRRIGVHDDLPPNGRRVIEEAPLPPAVSREVNPNRRPASCVAGEDGLFEELFVDAAIRDADSERHRCPWAVCSRSI